MMIHCPFVTMVGTADDLTTTAVTLRAIEARYCSAYSLRSGQDAAKVRKMMVKETWLSAAQAVESGGMGDAGSISTARRRDIAATVEFSLRQNGNHGV